MELLPKDSRDFGKEDYWNAFFSKQRSQHFEWYGEYDTLYEVLDKYIHHKDRVLVIGCGSSKLSASLYDVGFSLLVNIDISETVIKQMKDRYGKDRPQMTYEVMDVFNIKYEESSFAVVLDKGTLDALLPDSSEETSRKIDKMFDEIDKVLKNGGRYIIFSLLQEHVLSKILDWFTNKGWMMRFHRCVKAEATHEESLAFPVYCIICTKLKKLPNLPSVLEIVHEGVATPKRYTSKSEVTDYVKSSQQFAFLKHYLYQKKVVDEDIKLELCCPETGRIRYRMFVVDNKIQAMVPFAIFVVPQGREIEWLFSTSKGRQKLALNSDVQRLIVVHLLRDNVYKNVAEVKNDLSAKVLELAPSSFRQNVPILSLGDDVGQRIIRCCETSQLSGEFVVEDVQFLTDELFRRLIFLSNPNLVQSEVKLREVISKKKKKKHKLVVDFDYLSCNHHVAMISGLSFLKLKMLCPRILIIGLGGGMIAMYLYKHFPDAVIDVVELDPCILEVAKKWFDLITDDRLKVHLLDGIVFMQNAVENGAKYDAVILDVDNKDPSLGISSPPVAFLEKTVLRNMIDIVCDTGAVIMNLAARDSDLHQEAYTKLRSVFKCMYCRQIEDEVNEIIYAIHPGRDDVLSGVKENYAFLMDFLETRTVYSEAFDLKDIETALKEIT